MQIAFRTQLLVLLLGLGLTAIGATTWESSASATAALQRATFDRLTAVRETKRRQIEDYFAQLSRHTAALAADDSTLAALTAFSAAWKDLPATPLEAEAAAQLRRFYAEQTAARLDGGPDAWLPTDPRQQRLQHWFLSGNPFPLGAKEQLFAPDGGGAYAEAHARFHPTLLRYQQAFGLYDIFLIDASTRRVLYTVFKEIDLGADLGAAPHRNFALTHVFEAALAANDGEPVIVRDYERYPPSHLAPAAFLGAPIRRAGETIGTLAVQVSIEEVNRVMTGNRSWATEGLGRTGHAFIVGVDGRLRSDMRTDAEDIAAYVARLRESGAAPEAIESLERHNTGVLAVSAGPELTALATQRQAGTALGSDERGVPVLRSYAPAAIPGVDWFVVAEIEADEAFADVAALRRRLLGLGGAVAVLFLIAAAWLGRSVSAPLLKLADRARAAGHGDLTTRVPVAGPAELRHLAEALNRMAGDLDRTTVSRAELTQAHAQLQRLTERLLHAQEDERRKLARDLHDDATQQLASIAIELGRLKHLAPAGSDSQNEIAQLQTRLAGLARAIHGISRRLHPAILDDLGLGAALDALAQSVIDAGGPAVKVMLEGNVDAIEPSLRLTFYRVAQEALQNARRHGAASRIDLLVRNDAENAELIITDDGRGFDRGAPEWRPGLGLASIEERARVHGGHAAITSAAGHGTTVAVTIPRRHEPEPPRTHSDR